MCIPYNIKNGNSMITILQTACKNNSSGSIKALSWLLQNEKACKLLIGTTTTEKEIEDSDGGDVPEFKWWCTYAYTVAICSNNVKAIKLLSDQTDKHRHVIAKLVLTSHHAGYKIHDEKEDRVHRMLPLQLNLPIVTAALHSNLATFKLVLSLEPETINFATATFGSLNSNATLVLFAAQNENIGILRFLLSKQIVHSSMPDHHRQTAITIYYAVTRSVSNNHRNIIHYMCQMDDATRRLDIIYRFLSPSSQLPIEYIPVDYRYDVFTNEDFNNYSPFLHAVKIGNLGAAAWLYKKFPKESILVCVGKHRESLCALVLASKYGHCDILKWLLEIGCNISGKPLYRAIIGASEYNQLDVLKWFVLHGLFDPSETGCIRDCNSIMETKTPFAAAFENGHIEIVKYLYSVGAKLSDKVPIENTTILHYAVESKSFELLEWVGEVTNHDLTIVLGPNVHKDEDDGEDILSMACRLHRIDMVKWLTAPRVKLPVRSCPDGSPIVRACASGNMEIVEYLLFQCYDDHGKWVNYPLCDAIHRVAENGDIDMLKILVDHGIHVDKPDRRGWTPIVRVFMNDNRIPVMRWLQKRGADLSKRAPLGVGSVADYFERIARYLV